MDEAATNPALDPARVLREKNAVARLSVLSNSALVVGKLVAGLATGSVSVLSEAIHSAVDLAAALIAWFSVRFSGKPADRDHPYGHGKMENISGVVEGLLIFVAAGWIAWEAVAKLRHGAPLEAPGWGMAVMGASALVNLLISRRLMEVGVRTDSLALQADAVHLRTDVWTSAGVFAGLAAVWIGRWLRPDLDLGWIDPAAALAVSLLIAHAAWELVRDASGGLMDQALPPEEIEALTGMARAGGRLRSLHDVRTRKSGPERFVDAHVAVDHDLTVGEGHAQARGFKDEILLRWPQAQVNIHLDPCDGSCKAPCLSGCLLTEPDQAARHAAWRAAKAKGSRPG